MGTQGEKSQKIKNSKTEEAGQTPNTLSPIKKGDTVGEEQSSPQLDNEQDIKRGDNPQELRLVDHPIEEEWLYIGEGEWIPHLEVQDTVSIKKGDRPQRESKWIHQWRLTVDDDLRKHEEVLSKRIPQQMGCKDTPTGHLESGTFREPTHRIPRRRSY